LKKNVKQNEENNAKLNNRFYENLSQIKLDLADEQDKFNQKVLAVSCGTREPPLKKQHIFKFINISE
jgi:hypothetical protein